MVGPGSLSHALYGANARRCLAPCVVSMDQPHDGNELVLTENFTGKLSLNTIIARYLVVTELFSRRGPIVAAVLWFLASAIFVDLVGYWLHRWAHHPGSPLYRPHMTHHLVTYPPARVVASGRYASSGADSLALWFAPFGVVYTAAVLCSGMPHPVPILAGGAIVAALNSVLHDLTHVSGSIVWRWPWLLGIAVRHHAHHFKMGRNFGILSDVWDRAFGTRLEGGSGGPGGRRARDLESRLPSSRGQGRSRPGR